MSDTNPFLGFAGKLRADPPQRYINSSRYQTHGGKLRLEDDVNGFVANGMNSSDMARFYFFSLVFDQIAKEGLRGDLVELGVYKGNTATLLATYARHLGATAYLLDTFEGFSQKDLKGIDAYKNATFSDTSLEAVRALVGEPNVTYVKGFFPETAAQLPKDGTYCLVHIDCDLYAPIESALRYFYPRMVPGGFLIVHDYSSLHWRGAEKAVDEFFLDKVECPLPLPDSAGSVVIRKSRVATPGNSWLDRKRRAILSHEWALASNGNLADLLGAGWGAPEPWGIWGLGASHEMHVAPPLDHRAGLDLEFDVAAAVTPLRDTQVVDVLVRGEVLDSWTFTLSVNRGVRNLRVPGQIAVVVSPEQPWFDIEFRPRSVIAASEIVPGSTDTRPLGLRLYSLRLAKK